MIPFLAPSPIKINIDGSARDKPSIVACGAMFCESRATLLLVVSLIIVVQKMLYAEILAIIMSLMHAEQKGYTKGWIEADSQVSILAFANTLWFLGILGLDSIISCFTPK